MDRPRKPSLLPTFTEALRTFLDAGRLCLTPPVWNVPASAARTVLVLPGFGLSDAAALPLRTYLRGLGHRVPHGFAGPNLGLRKQVLHRLAARVQARAEQDGAPVVLVGHSLGALYARMLAWMKPHAVSEVVSLAGPMRDCEGHGSHAMAWYRLLNPDQNGRDGEARDLFQQAMNCLPPVPLTCVFTYDDGVLDWRTTVVPGRFQGENLAVAGSHNGLLVNPVVWRLLALRLAAPAPWAPLRLPADLVGQVVPTPVPAP